MPGFVTRLTDGCRRAWSHVPLALVPIVFALLNTNKLDAVLAFDGGHVGVKFGFPFTVVTIWQFVSVPSSGVTVSTGVPLESLPLAAVAVPVLLVVRATLTAGYFGSIRNAIDDEPYDFLDNCRQHFWPFLVLTAVPFLAFLPLAIGAIGASGRPGGVGGPGVALILLALVGFVVAGYLFYATPYLIVLREVGVIEAARHSYSLALTGGPYFTYALGFAVFVLGVSPIATALVVNLPAVGLPIGILGGGFLGLAANVTTMRFVADVDPGSSVASSWETEAPGPST